MLRVMGNFATESDTGCVLAGYPEQILHCERLVEPLLNPESPEFEYARTHGMQQLAMVNGFSLNKAEQRCGICGALGHLGFECPETNNQNYKMANVTCTICGDKGHVASDCKKAAEINKRENVDWKAMAEKKAQMDKDFNDMMNDMGGLGGAGQAGGQASGTGQTLVTMDAATPGAGQSNVDKTIIVPGHLVGKIIGPAGATIKKMAADTGAQINMDSVVQPGGGKAVVITAADPTARERAKAHVQNWIKDNQTPVGGPGYGGGGLGGMQPIGGMGGKGGPLGGGMGGKGMGPPLGGGLGMGGGMAGPAGMGGMGGMGPGMGPMGGKGGMGPMGPGGMGKGMGPPPMGGGMGMGGKGMGGGCGMGMQNMPKSTGGLMPGQQPGGLGMRPPGQMGGYY
ncbi:bbp-1 [Symbiodinium natans]|uniref:Bbp-1 protein n=1 Tax=Symbiodinium natans TaxID=878477 RepID=A0A812R4A8_9DINO|nr:bbp-1 [Symbiodinium natans]